MTALDTVLMHQIYDAMLTGRPLAEALRPFTSQHDEVVFTGRLQDHTVPQNANMNAFIVNGTQAYMDDFIRVAHQNPLAPILMKAPVDELVDFNAYKDFRELEETPYNREFLIRHNGISKAVGVILRREGTKTAQVVANIPKAYNGNSYDELRSTMQRIVPVLRSAYSYAHEMHLRQQEQAIDVCGRFWLEQIPTPAFILGKGGKVKAFNEAATRFLKASPMLWLDRHNMLNASLTDHEQNLQDMVATCLTQHVPVGPMVLNHPKGLGVMAQALPLHGLYEAPDYHRFFMADSTHMLLTLFDPADVQQAPEELVGGILGTTDKQTKLILELAKGRGLRESADSLGISYNTARNHIQNAAGRAGLNSQTELVRVVSAISAHAGQFSSKK
ncbi:helix-turn-helix transcriptional regulator [Pseudovibrio sp. SPO723]|uniref:helix-turn-helix transcriptional regulator n=1 Tax=Nesiotobacter zosterae TaxID=392721 RepID=UPI0029C3C1EA|nr:helix-turn-helix transcriptional regulator [Pseudovibrio sp. SPO723]MDX5593374.1 helix-turn-helix transcriptional regulator [Pseudovibrio sp. SPO723]